MQWINLIEKLQPQWNNFSKEKQEEIYEMLFCNYEQNCKNIKKAVRKKLKVVEKSIRK